MYRFIQNNQPNNKLMLFPQKRLNVTSQKQNQNVPSNLLTHSMSTPPIPLTMSLPAETYGSKTFSLFSQPYLDTYNQCYKNIVVVNLPPLGPLGVMTKRVNFPVLSQFKTSGPCNPIKQCGLALRSLDSCSNGCKYGSDLMTTDEVPNLISFLFANHYNIDTNITNMLNDSDLHFNTNNENKLICFVTYQGE